jgi:hypothetical protein
VSHLTPSGSAGRRAALDLGDPPTRADLGFAVLSQPTDQDEVNCELRCGSPQRFRRSRYTWPDEAWMSATPAMAAANAYSGSRPPSWAPCSENALVHRRYDTRRRPRNEGRRGLEADRGVAEVAHRRCSGVSIGRGACGASRIACAVAGESLRAWPPCRLQRLWRRRADGPQVEAVQANQIQAASRQSHGGAHKNSCSRWSAEAGRANK